MGSTCETCTNSHNSKVILNVAVIHTDWADAVTKNNLAGIAGLHAENPSLINEYVDQRGCVAIHYAIRSKNEHILLYLLKHDANINARGGTNYNTPLHEAALANNFKAVSYLYGHSKIKVNDKLTNNENKTAIELCQHKRKYVTAKEHGIGESRQRALDRKPSSIYFHGQNLETTSKQTIHRIVMETNDEKLFVKRKKEEIRYREKAVTRFGEDCGVDIDEIAMVLVEGNAIKIWQQLTKNSGRNKRNINRNTDCVTKQTEIRKILLGLTNAAFNKKHFKKKKPPDQALKLLTRALCKKLPKKNGKAILEKQVFLKQFHTFLFQVHNEMIVKQ